LSGTIIRRDADATYVQVIESSFADHGALYVKQDPGGSGTALHALNVYQAGDSGEGSAGNFSSDNQVASCVMISGEELGRGSLKITHRGQADGSDASASALAIDLGSVAGTAAQGIALVATTPTIGSLLLLRNTAGKDDFVVKANGKVGIGITAGATPFGMVDARPVDASTRGFFAKAFPASAAKLIELQDENGVMVFGISQSVTDIQNAYRPTPNDYNSMGATFDPWVTVSNTALTAGQVVLLKVWATKSGNVNNISVATSNSPATLSNTFLGLYDTGGTRLGLTADLSAAWNGSSAGERKAALTAAVPVVLGQAYYIAVLVGAGGTLPNLLRGGQNAVVNAGFTAAGTHRSMTSGSGLTALPASITMSGAAAATNPYWAMLAA
jgi:hyaluronidase-like protein HylP